MSSSIIEVGIGVILIYSVLSVLVSQINTIVKNALNLRGAAIRKQLETMLQDPKIQRKFLEHPTVQSLLEAKDSAATIATPGVLAGVLVDVLAGKGEVLSQFEALADSELVNAIMDSVGDPGLENSLRSVIMTARNLEEVAGKFEKWFDNGLKRGSELFRRRIQFFSFVVALVISVTMNIDTLHVAETLWNDPVLRQTTVNTADASASRLGRTLTAEPTEALQESFDNAQDTVQDLLALRLPVGWFYQPIDQTNTSLVLPSESDSRNLWNFIPGNNPDWLGMLLAKILGLGISTIAVMQGAPFWFDLLRRFTGQGSGTSISSTRSSAPTTTVIAPVIPPTETLPPPTLRG